MAKGSDPSGMKVSVTPPGKEWRPAEVLVEGEENGQEKKVVINVS